MHFVECGSEFGQTKRVFESNFHISTTQDIAHDVVIGGNSASDASNRHLAGNSTFRGELHGKATSVQSSDFLFLVGSRERGSLDSCGQISCETSVVVVVYSKCR